MNWKILIIRSALTLAAGYSFIVVGKFTTMISTPTIEISKLIFIALGVIAIYLYGQNAALYHT